MLLTVVKRSIFVIQHLADARSIILVVTEFNFKAFYIHKVSLWIIIVVIRWIRCFNRAEITLIGFCQPAHKCISGQGGEEEQWWETKSSHLQLFVICVGKSDSPLNFLCESEPVGDAVVWGVFCWREAQGAVDSWQVIVDTVKTVLS